MRLVVIVYCCANTIKFKQRPDKSEGPSTRPECDLNHSDLTEDIGYLPTVLKPTISDIMAYHISTAFPIQHQVPEWAPLVFFGKSKGTVPQSASITKGHVYTCSKRCAVYVIVKPDPDTLQIQRGKRNTNDTYKKYVQEQ